MIRETVTASPLSWPAGWARTARPSRARFTRSTVYGATQGILVELGRMGIDRRRIVISTNHRLKPDGTPYANQRRVDDPGAAVWFELAGAERVLACDRWDLLGDNLLAIELHVGAIRGQDRWGVGSAAQAFAGFVALPEQAGGPSWWNYFGLDPLSATEDEVQRAYRDSAKLDHPDAGGDRLRWDELQSMRRMALDVVRARNGGRP